MSGGDMRTSVTGLVYNLHPLVLLNVSDHHVRIKANDLVTPSGRVYGCLLGQQQGRDISISNSFELLVREDMDGEFNVDEAYLTKKLDQYKQTFASLDVVGWYTTGANLTPTLMTLHQRIAQMNESAALLLFNTDLSGQKELPVYLYESEFHAVDGVPQSVFVKASYTVQTSEAERIAVKQVASSLSSEEDGKAEELSAHYGSLLAANQMLVAQITKLLDALRQMVSGTIPMDYGVLREVSSLLRRVPIEGDKGFNSANLTEVNDAMLTILMGSLTQGSTQVLDLIERCEVAYPRR